VEPMPANVLNPRSEVLWQRLHYHIHIRASLARKQFSKKFGAVANTPYYLRGTGTDHIQTAVFRIRYSCGAPGPQRKRKFQTQTLASEDPSDLGLAPSTLTTRDEGKGKESGSKEKGKKAGTTLSFGNGND
jgi:hypothetical protein